MKTWKLLLEYDGGRYSGWQEQRNARTVMGELRKAAESVLQTDVEIQGAGRTDSGVHAWGQVAHLRAEVRRAVPDLRLRLNEALPYDIAVRDASEAQPRFHARHDARTRTYVYRYAVTKSAFTKDYVWWIKQPLDVAAMAQAAGGLAGRHDFVGFRAKDPAGGPEESTIVVVENASIELEGDLVLFRIEASHFLYRMVRRLAGAIAKVGIGELTVEQFTDLLKARPNPGVDVAPWTAPAAGLFLEKVTYREVSVASAKRDPQWKPAPKAAKQTFSPWRN